MQWQLCIRKKNTLEVHIYSSTYKSLLFVPALTSVYTPSLCLLFYCCIHTCAMSSSCCTLHTLFVCHKLSSSSSSSSLFFHAWIERCGNEMKRKADTNCRSVSFFYFRKCSGILGWDLCAHRRAEIRFYTHTELCLTDCHSVGLWTVLPPFCISKVGRWPCFCPGSDAAFHDLFILKTDEMFLYWHAFTCWKKKQDFFKHLYDGGFGPS